jgi:hypothetical protein
MGHRKRMVHMGIPFLTEIPFFHHSCIHNEKAAIVNRVLGDTPKTSPDGAAKMRKVALLLGRSLPKTIREPLGHFALQYGGAKRKRYLDAANSILDGYTTRDAGVTMFVKWSEKQFVDSNKLNPDPRAVQFRDPKYCVAIAQFLKPIEPHLYELKIDHPLIARSRLVGKGLNQTQRAMLLYEKMANFKRPVVVGLDCKRFDKHVTKENLEAEHIVYLLSNNDPEFAKLLSWQFINKCRTRSGFRYKTSGKRMSGDMNTALGNCIIMICMILTAFIYYIKVHFDILDDGDDCLVIFESENLELVLQKLPRSFLTFGHILKIERIAHDMESVLWCQSQPVEYSPGLFKFIRNPLKTIASDLVSSKYLSCNRLAQIKAIGQCELALNLGVPVLQDYALALLRNSCGNVIFDFGSPLFLRARREIHNFESRAETLEPKPINLCARMSFAKAFGISILEQLDLERQIQNWSPNFYGSQTFFSTYDDNWKLSRELVELVAH